MNTESTITDHGIEVLGRMISGLEADGKVTTIAREEIQSFLDTYRADMVGMTYAKLLRLLARRGLALDSDVEDYTPVERIALMSANADIIEAITDARKRQLRFAIDIRERLAVYVSNYLQNAIIALVI
jgi:hypothetical protein